MTKPKFVVYDRSHKEPRAKKYSLISVTEIKLEEYLQPLMI